MEEKNSVKRSLNKIDHLINLYKYDLTEDQLKRFLEKTGEACDMTHVKSMENIRGLSLIDTVTYFLNSPYNHLTFDSYPTTIKVLLEMRRQLGHGGIDPERSNLYNDLHYIIHWNHNLMRPTNAMIHRLASMDDYIYGMILTLETIEHIAYRKRELATHILKTLMSLTDNLYNYIWFVSLSCVDRSGKPFSLLETLVEEGVIEKPKLENGIHPLYFVDYHQTISMIQYGMGPIKPQTRFGKEPSTSEISVYNFVVKLNSLYELNLHMDEPEFIQIPAMSFFQQGGSRKVRKTRKTHKRKQSRRSRKQN